MISIHRPIRPLFTAVLFLGYAATLVSAQRPAQDFNRTQTYDVQHYSLRTSFDRPQRKVIGDTTVRIQPLKENFRTAEFDAVDLRFDSVTLVPSGVKLDHRASGGKVVVTLDRAYSPSEPIDIRFRYTATPRKGVYFVDEIKEGVVTLNPSQIWTQGEPDEHRHWIPSFDFPSDKATTEQYITAPIDERVIANGELVSRTENPNGTATWHYRMDVPHSLYLLSFIVGKYSKVDDKYGDIPLAYYVYPGRESLVPLAYGKTKDMMRVFEEVTGVKYPFNKYEQTTVAGFTFGGMENITATTMADTEISAVTNPLFKAGVEDLVSHELAHSWFGNLVTTRNWAELWLNEGFATFMEAVFREKTYGRRNYLNKIKYDAEMFIADDAVNAKRFGLFNRRAGNVAELFERPATTYNKGGAVLHTLREEIGDEAFWKAVNLYLTRHKFGSVETPDLIKAIEEASGRDLGWFFDQWVYGTGHPKLEIREAWNPSSKTLRLTVAQVQKQDGLTPLVFRLPLEVELKTASGKEIRKIEVTKRLQTFDLKVDARPTEVVIDPNEKVPVKTVKIIKSKPAK